MKYIEVCINTPTEEIDFRCESLAAMGVGGFVIENEEDFQNFLQNNHQYWDYVDEELENQYAGVSRIKFYLLDDEEGQNILHRVRNEYSGIQVSSVEDSDWENNWREYYKPINVGEKLVVVPEWEDVPDTGRFSLRLDPGLIFGTGSHATTRMCLSSMEAYISADTSVLDLGCGSGILGIGALVLGAKCCVGCDIDPKAPDVAMSNAALNSIYSDRMQVFAGDIISDASLRKRLGTGYDLVLANIVSDVIIHLAPHVRQFMNSGAVFICSGIIEGRQDEVENTLISSGLEIIGHRCEEEWHCFICR